MRLSHLFTLLSLTIPSSISGYTVSFSRKLDTCDHQDQILTDGTTKLVYAYSSVNPSTTNNEITYHQHRGTQSIRLMDAKPVDPVMPKDAYHVDFTYNTTTIPFPSYDPTTSYYCKLFEFAVPSRSHIVRWEPIFNPPQNTKYVHHILAFECPTALPADVGFHQLCDNLPERLAGCLSTTVVSAWAVGGVAFNYPSNIGYPVGGPSVGAPGTVRYVMMQTHYNNQEQISPLIDSSGMRYTLTTNDLRPIESGMLMQGYVTSSIFSIPPGVKDYMYSAPCTSECTKQLFPTPVKIIATLLHMHTTGKAIKTRHFRNGTELSNILSDGYYDFNFQDFEYQAKEIDFYPGDELLTECHYDTTGRINATTFGESTRQEMCLSFMIYYPRIQDSIGGQCSYGNFSGMPDIPAPYNVSTMYCGNTSIYNFAPITITTPLPILNCTHTTPDVVVPITRDISAFNPSSYARSIYINDTGATPISIYWNIDRINDMIHFAIDVDVAGWIGLGFSPTGGMINADVLTAWIGTSNTTDESANLHVQDRFATAHALPAMDMFQDITNIVFYTNTGSSSSSSSSLSTEAIIGIAAGGGLVLLIMIACIYRRMCIKRDTSTSHRLLAEDGHKYG